MFYNNNFLQFYCFISSFHSPNETITQSVKVNEEVRNNDDYVLESLSKKCADDWEEKEHEITSVFDVEDEDLYYDVLCWWNRVLWLTSWWDHEQDQHHSSESQHNHNSLKSSLKFFKICWSKNVQFVIQEVEKKHH